MKGVKKKSTQEPLRGWVREQLNKRGRGGGKNPKKIQA